MSTFTIKIIHKNPNNSVFCGLSKSFTGVLELLKEVFPTTTERKILSNVPGSVLILLDKKNQLFAHVEELPHKTIDGDNAWVVTKREPETNSETVWGIFDKKDKSVEFVERHLDDNPIWYYKEKCKIYEVDGYKPFHKIIGDENPELNKLHFTIYETEVK